MTGTIGRVPRFPEHLQQHFDRPHCVGEPPGGADLCGEAVNSACGDRLAVYLQCAPQGGRGDGHEEGRDDGRPPRRVQAAGFRAQGCPAAMATASAACSLLPGLPLDAGLPEALALRFEQDFGAPLPAHRHALALFAQALRELAPLRPRGGGSSPPGDR
jgi:hypothetical protein